MWHCGASGIGGWKLEMPLHVQKYRSVPMRMTPSQRQLLKCCQCIKSGCVRFTEQTPIAFAPSLTVSSFDRNVFRSFVFNVITCPVGFRSVILLFFYFFNCLGLPRATRSLDDSLGLPGLGSHTHGCGSITVKDTDQNLQKGKCGVLQGVPDGSCPGPFSQESRRTRLTPCSKVGWHRHLLLDSWGKAGVWRKPR